ncbi:MAG: hypothetical protein JAY60_18500 [Candidatus Thiodiazotropha weberae]|nr:hypothetical protein [Candidatus Thiodiazotropha weberae]
MLIQKNTRSRRYAIGNLSVNRPGLYGVGNIIQRVGGSLIYSLPSTSTEYITLGDLTDARATTGTVTDFEGITRTIPAGIPLREGCRVVENICVAPSDLQDASWIPSNGAVVLNATQWQTGTGGVNSQMRTDVIANVQVGERYRVHLKLAIADKSVATSWRIGFYMAGGGAAAGSWLDITADVSDQEQWLTAAVAEITAVGTGLYAIVHAIGSTGVTTVTQSEVFIEEVTGQVNQNPSTFVDGFAYSDYENGNTVASNVVTSGQGAAISGAYWLHDNTQSTGIQEAFTDFPQDAGTVRVRFSPQYNKGAIASDNGVAMSSTNSLFYFGTSGNLTAGDGTSTASITTGYSSGDILDVYIPYGNGTFNIIGENETTASGYQAGTEAAYDGAFPSDDILRIFAGLAAVCHISSLDIYNRKHTQAQIEAGL